ncbi:dehydrogenase, E1 component, thiamine diphosphate-binding fold protein [Tanacetum coccineum]
MSIWLIEVEKVVGLEYPGGKIAFTSEMNFLPGSNEERVKCYRLLDQDGYPISSNMPEHVGKELALKIYINMVTLETMDTLFYEAQRQGRFSFYMSSFGEEAINIASAASLSPDDHILAQYREQGVLLWRGFTLQEFANHFLGNKIGHGKGRNMPIHYGSKKLNYFTNSAPLATQLPHAVGVAYSLKNDRKDACVVTYFGEGSTSEGDFHASMNFAAVLEAPIVFICRNNGWAISTPVTDQFRSDGIVVKGQAYGIQSIRVDGNDVLAVYDAVRSAREIAIKEQRPILIEAMTYRVGHHSTSDDSTKYRTKDEINHWRTVHSPITRFRKWMERKGWWTENEDSDLHIDVHKQVKNAIDEAEREEKPALEDMFKDVYEELIAIFTLSFSYKLNMSIWLTSSRRSCGNLVNMARRYKSVKSGKELFSSKDDDKSSFEDNHGLVYPGGKIAFTSEMSFLPGSSEERVKCYRVLDQDGYRLISSNTPENGGSSQVRGV